MSLPETERPQPLSDPQEILSIKDNLLTEWAKLPPEHQTTMLFVFLGHIRGDYQTWVREAIHTLSGEPSARGDETSQEGIPFPITSLSRTDLKVILSEDEVGLLTDNDLREIARYVEDAYVDRGDFWEDLGFFASRMVKEKQNKPEDL